MTSSEVIADNLHFAMRGMKATEFALAANVSQATLSKLRSGQTNVTLRSLDGVAAALGWTTLELLTPGQGARLEIERLVRKGRMK